jgi:hypothetical protein
MPLDRGHSEGEGKAQRCLHSCPFWDIRPLPGQTGTGMVWQLAEQLWLIKYFTLNLQNVVSSKAHHACKPGLISLAGLLAGVRVSELVLGRQESAGFRRHWKGTRIGWCVTCLAQSERFPSRHLENTSKCVGTQRLTNPTVLSMLGAFTTSSNPANKGVVRIILVVRDWKHDCSWRGIIEKCVIVTCYWSLELKSLGASQLQEQLDPGLSIACRPCLIPSVLCWPVCLSLRISSRSRDSSPFFSSLL